MGSPLRDRCLLKGIALVLLALWASAAFAGPASAQEGWKSWEIGGVFRFSTPPGLSREDAQGVDSLAGALRDKDAYLVFDYGLYSFSGKDLVGAPGYREESVEVDGKKAILRWVDAPGFGPGPEYAYFAMIHFPATRESRNALTMTLACKSRKACEPAQAIFRSIRFD